jgi:murein DD-endopeptidase MepM/ murein hydrolase activator NlpD
MKVFDIIVEAEAQGKIVVVGDTIAQGIGSAIPNAVVSAGPGLDSASIASKVMSDNNLKGADLAIVSAGTYDVKPDQMSITDPDATGANLRAIKRALGAKKIVWIRPYNAGASFVVSQIANIDGDKTIDLKLYPTADKKVPGSYGDIVKASTYGMQAVAPTNNNKDAKPEVQKQLDDEEKKKADSTEKKKETPATKYPYDKNLETLQANLVALGFNLPKYGVDGYWGDETREAIKAFQKANGKEPTGLPSRELDTLIATQAKDPTKTTKPGQSAKVNRSPGNNRSTSTPGSPIDGPIQITDVPGSARKGHTHNGVDIRANESTAVKSPIDGVVDKVYSSTTGGNTVSIQSANGDESHVFMHLSKISVSPKQQVKAGDMVGYAGRTGQGVTGPHLHWEKYVNKQRVNPLDGQQWAWASGYGPEANQSAKKK